MVLVGWESVVVKWLVVSGVSVVEWEMVSGKWVGVTWECEKVACGNVSQGGVSRECLAHYASPPSERKCLW